MTKYGVVSDIHTYQSRARQAAKKFVDEDVDSIILNGDFGARRNTLQGSQDDFMQMLLPFADTQKKVYVQPGSHESFGVFMPVTKALMEEYSNVIPTFTEPEVHEKDHEIQFLQGSDWLAGGEFKLGTDAPSGTYLRTQQGLVPATQKNVQAIQEATGQVPLLNYTNAEDLESRVTDPAKTTVIAHVPRKFDVLGAVDTAYFAENQEGDVMSGKALEENIRRQTDAITKDDISAIAKQHGYEFKEENRGNEELRDIYNRLGISKAVSGHFHETSHVAHNGTVQPVEEGVATEELYWNSGHGDKGHIGILTLEDATATYRNIRLEDL